jgi:hypothetical protein
MNPSTTEQEALMVLTYTTTEVQEIDPKFKDPEFYDNGVVLTVSLQNGGSIDIVRDGESVMYYGKHTYITSSDFREAFPSGKLYPFGGDVDEYPRLEEDEPQRIDWKYNGWFDCYDSLTGDHLDIVTFDLNEAISEALLYLRKEANV